MLYGGGGVGSCCMVEGLLGHVAWWRGCRVMLYGGGGVGSCCMEEGV